MKKSKKNSSATTAFLHAIATAVPEHRLDQTEILDFMQRLQADTPEKAAFMQKIYAGSAIQTRHSVLADYRRQWADFEFYPRNPELEPSPGTAKRNQVFVQEADRLAMAAGVKLFTGDKDHGLRIGPSAITHLVTVSCTGFSAPGFDLTVQKQLGLGDHVQRFHLGFMGCYAAFPALKLAQNLCRADPSARVLIIDIELCTLHFQKAWETDTIVANALFADGAAAALVSANANDSHAPLYSLDDFATKMIPGSSQEMAWIIGDTGFDMKLSSYVPRVIDGNMPEILDGLLARNNQSQAGIRHWAIHPGGRAILDKLALSLELPDTALQSSYETLRDYGNMSSATIFFVLKNMAAKSRPSQGESPSPVFAAAFGPGLTVESALLCLLPRPPASASQSHSIHQRQALFWPDLSQRCHLPELMDDPEIDVKKLRRTINQFTLLNRLFSAYRSILEREFFSLMVDPQREYSLLDIGCGGGDIAIWLAKTARARGIRLKITAIDQDERVIPWARENASAYGEIEIRQASAEGIAALGDFDFMFCNHVLHHLEERAIVSLLKTAQTHCRINFVFNDILRDHWAYIGYTIFTGLFIRGSLALYDGRLSIRRGFKVPELQALIDQAGFRQQLRVQGAKPARLYISRIPMQ